MLQAAQRSIAIRLYTSDHRQLFLAVTVDPKKPKSLFQRLISQSPLNKRIFGSIVHRAKRIRLAALRTSHQSYVWERAAGSWRFLRIRFNFTQRKKGDGAGETDAETNC